MVAFDQITVRELIFIGGAASAGSTAAGGKPGTTLVTAGSVVGAAVVAALANSRLQRRNEAATRAQLEADQRRTSRERRIELAREILPYVRSADLVRAAAPQGKVVRHKTAAAAAALRTATDLALTRLPDNDELTIVLADLVASFDDLCSASGTELSDALEIYDITHSRFMRSLRPPRHDVEREPQFSARRSRRSRRSRHPRRPRGASSV